MASQNGLWRNKSAKSPGWTFEQKLASRGDSTVNVTDPCKWLENVQTHVLGERGGELFAKLGFPIDKLGNSGLFFSFFQF